MQQGKFFEDFVIGEESSSMRRTVTEADIQQFAGLSGDYNPLHVDDIYAKEGFGRRIAHGALTFAISTGLGFLSGAGTGTVIAFAGTELKFTAPVFAGDTIHLVSKCVDKIEMKKPDRGLVVVQTDTVNQDGVVVLNQIQKFMVKRKS